MAAKLALHQHGKGKVRLGRTWRQGDVHHFVEYMVHTMLESDMEHAFVRGDNTDMTATDTQKNTVSAHYLLLGCARIVLRTVLMVTTWHDRGFCASTQVYHIAKQFDRPCSPEEFALALAKHFVKQYPRVGCGWDANVVGQGVGGGHHLGKTLLHVVYRCPRPR